MYSLELTVVDHDYLLSKIVMTYVTHTIYLLVTTGVV